MNSHANRGMNLESLIEWANARYRNRKIAVMTKQHTHFVPIRDNTGRVVSCKVEEEATVDYMGRYRNVPVAIEAKHTSGKRISFSEVKDHQAEYLDDFTGQYGLGFGAVLVSFGMERFFLIPWYFWSKARDLWKNPKSKGEKETIEEYGMIWTTTGKASVSADELLPEWEIKVNGSIGLDYMKNVKKYIQK